MDIKKIKKEEIHAKNIIKEKNNPLKMWVAVFICMAVIVTIWGIWLYPKSLKISENDEAENKFLNFKNTITDSLSIFKKNEKNKPEEEQELDIQYLRHRVFGETKTRPE